MGTFKAGVLTFPGSNCDRDMFTVLKDFFKADVEMLWHGDSIDKEFDLLVVPGGFSYGDYLRAGAIARFAPAMQSLQSHAKSGRPVLGICNGFQILCEAKLLPGALIRNRDLKHIAKDVILTPSRTSFTGALDTDRTYRIPVSHSEGNFRISDDGLKQLKDNGQIAFRYTENPNGSMDDIAGIVNQAGNILGMMPHPERATDPVNGNTDGRLILDSLLSVVK